MFVCVKMSSKYMKLGEGYDTGIHSGIKSIIFMGGEVGDFLRMIVSLT